MACDSEIWSCAAEDAFRSYASRFGNDAKSEEACFHRVSFPWTQAEVSGHASQDMSDAQIKVLLERDFGFTKGGARGERMQVKKGKERAAMGNHDKDSMRLRNTMVPSVCAEDSDGELIRLCQQCSLPLGVVVYKGCLHGECMAQHLVQDLQTQEQNEIAINKDKKSQLCEEYSIGWKMQYIPCSRGPASKLAMRDVAEGMLCVAYHDATCSIRLASTTEPAAAINLEYLSTALECRRREGHEPYFSLEAVHDAKTVQKHVMQEKLFEPEWLAGTNVGEVLFQADYYLKGLSMGEHEQPVVGMRSPFDTAEFYKGSRNWSSRQWFIVRKANVDIWDGDAVIPNVKLGVEAREQVDGGGHKQDKALTRPDHPSAQYAEAFTHYFDLIAERKSVIYHLRELARASVLAKFLLESHVRLEDGWFDLWGVVQLACPMEVPQIWNQRRTTRVRIEDGAVLGKRSKEDGIRGVYGGVAFGLEKFSFAAHRQRLRSSAANLSLPSRSSLRGASFGLGALRAAATPAGPLSAVSARSAVSTLGAGGLAYRAWAGLPLPTKQSLPVTHLKTLTEAQVHPLLNVSAARHGSAGSAPRVFIVPPSAGILGTKMKMLPLAAPQAADLAGVDLRLDSFDVSLASRASVDIYFGGQADKAGNLDDCVSLGKNFWSSLESNCSPFKDHDYELLRQIFNPRLCDRQMEGDKFVPPDARHSHVSKLRLLVEEEQTLRRRRLEVFLSEEFKMSEPGCLFPSSWTPRLGIAGHAPRPVTENGTPGSFVKCPEYKNMGANILQGLLSTVEPIFDRSSEEGMQFRIYRVGNMEVRTTQETNCLERVGVVFSICCLQPEATTNRQVQLPHPQDRIVKAAEYVERNFAKDGFPGCRYYLVLRTEQGHSIVTERLGTGLVTWDVDPDTLQDRNSLAKVIRASDCTTGVIVRDLQRRVSKATQDAIASPTTCKLWAHSTFARVVGSSVTGMRSKREEDPILSAKKLPIRA